MQSTLYLKYRPSRIADLDLTEVKEMMTKLLSGVKDGKTDKLPHAWLFSGPRGTGKTSTARILAKVLNCEKRKGIEPCNECEMCREISAGTAVDVIEIDAASNRGIDEIRELKEKIRLAPMRAAVKVYIIDEVHMLTTEAANALLKTLEEPPENTCFILCTTEAEKLPETVVSRCTRVVFRKPTPAEAVGSLERVIEGEKIKAKKEGLEMLVKAARGSFRDATKFLEQVSLFAGEVTEETVKQVLGVMTTDDAREFTDLVEKTELKKSLELIERLDKQGVNLRRFAESAAEIWREKLLNSAGKNQAETARLLSWLADMDTAYEQMKSSVLPQLPLEVFVVKVCGGGQQSTTTKPGPVEKTGVQETAETKPEKKEEKEEKKDAVKPEEPQPAAAATAGGAFSLADLEGKWAEILKSVRPMNHSVEALLRSTKPIAFDGEKLELEVFYKFHKDKLETEKCRTIVENAVKEIFSVAVVKLYLKLGQGKKKKEELSADAVGQDIVKAAEEIFGVEAV